MKKFLLWLFWIISLWLINFSSAFDYPGFTKVWSIHIDTTNFSTYFNWSTVSPSSLQSSNLWFYCSVLENFSYIYDNLQDTSTNTNNLISLWIWITANTVSDNNSYLRTSLKTFSKEYFNWKDIVICGSNFLSWFTAKALFVWVNNSNSNFLINWIPNMSFDWSLYYASFDYKCPTCPTCEVCDYSSYQSQIDSLTSSLSGCSSSYNQCITDYWNCSSSLNYCYYDLWDCRAWNCSGEYFSNLFINNVSYPWSANIFVNVPQEFDFNYSLTWSDSAIDIEYKTDPDYVQSIIDINSYRPTSEDFTDTFVSGLTLVMPYIVIVLFIIFVWKLLKKIFR